MARTRSATAAILPLFLAAPGLRAETGFDSARMVWADKVIEAAIAKGDIPGAVLLVGQGDRIVFEKAYGNRAVQPDMAPMTTDTIFDMASVSKVVGCATSVMLLIERGQLNLSDKVARYLPAFGAAGKEDITVEQLLLHRGGLIPDNSLADYKEGPEKAWELICGLEPRTRPGTQFAYTDVGFIVLGELVRAVDGRPLDVFAREEIFEPLGMKDTGYKLPEALKSRCAATEQRGGKWIVGDVHDPRAWALGGVAGHAGMFSTVADMSRWCRMILGGGTLEGRRLLSDMTVREMSRARCFADGSNCRGYGFDVDTGYSSARGNLFEAGTTFGHTGFTGTSFWIDPATDSYLVFLTNAVHLPKGTVIDLRRRVATVVASAIVDRQKEYHPPTPRLVGTPVAAAPKQASGAPADVVCGIDVLERDGFKILAGRKIALITNHTGRNRAGRRTVDILTKTSNVQVVKLFSPEHGLYGTLDEKVGNTVDKETGLQVFSLYGETRRPSAAMLEGVDTIVYDIQDIGARFYTYPATLGNAMEEAAKLKIRVIVLDRPNPITGLTVDGPLADSNRLGFTAYMEMPVVHGMTIGELAKMFNAEKKIGCDLVVVPCEGWKRAMWWDETGLLWTNPSPNMRNLTQATLYPAICLLEATNLSVGRGTDQPFEFFGAPWIDALKLARELNAAGLPGLRFVPFEFTPAKGSKLGGQPCQGIYVLVTDRTAIQHVRSGLTIAWTLRKLFGDKFEVDKVNNLLVSAETLAAMKATDDPAKLAARWKPAVAQFQRLRSKYLMYK